MKPIFGYLSEALVVYNWRLCLKSRCGNSDVSRSSHNYYYYYYYYKRAALTRRFVPRNFKVTSTKISISIGLTQQVLNICSAISSRVWACEKLCLQSPLKYWQWWRWRDERWQTVPDSCRRDRKRAVTNSRVLRSRNDERRRVCWSKRAAQPQYTATAILTGCSC